MNLMRTIEPVPAYQLTANRRPRFRKRALLLTLGIALLVLLAATLLAPLLTKRGVSAWLYYQAHRSGLRISFAEIRAPLLRPIEIYDLRIVGAGERGAHFELIAPKIEAGLSFAALLGQSNATHKLRTLHVEHARVFVRGRPQRSAPALDWTVLATLLPDEFDISADQVLFVQPVTRLEIRDGTISASKERSGNVSIGSIEMRAPALQKQFADVHGVTRWQNDQLTLASLRLLDGLTVDSIGVDLAHLSAARIAAELGATIFGGNIRANVATDRAGVMRSWEIAATASGVSLGQLTTALGTTEQVRGALHAMKFTFHGDPRDLLHASGAIWTELTGFEWRQRRADVIMLGASLSDRTIQLQQLYVKQRANELTVSGETKLSADWLNPDFRGDISASVADLGQLAELLGGSADAFGGKIAARGRVHAYERKIDGELVVTGDGLTLARNPVDSFTARLTIDGPHLRLEEFQLRRANDSLQAAGQLDWSAQAFDLSGKIFVNELDGYSLGKHWLGSGRLSGELHANGTTADFRADLNAELDQLLCAAKTRWSNGSLAVESLKVTTTNASAELSGSMSLLHGKISANFSTNDELRFDYPFQDSTCFRGLRIDTGDTGFVFSALQLEQDQLVFTGGGERHVVSLCTNHRRKATPARINIPPRNEPKPPQVP